jgi:hypothetical protein
MRHELVVKFQHLRPCVLESSGTTLDISPGNEDGYTPRLFGWCGEQESSLRSNSSTSLLPMPPSALASGVTLKQAPGVTLSAHRDLLLSARAASTCRSQPAHVPRSRAAPRDPRRETPGQPRPAATPTLPQHLSRLGARDAAHGSTAAKMGKQSEIEQLSGRQDGCGPCTAAAAKESSFAPRC